MTRTFTGMVVFAVMIVILIGMLRLVSWIPSAVQDGAFRRYRTVDDVRAHLKISPIYEPVYYPRSIQWPPTLVAAQTTPYPAVVMEFRTSGSADADLIITQTALPHAPLMEPGHMRTVRAKISFPLKDRPAVLESGTCGGGGECSRLTWDDGTYGLILVMNEAPVELVRMAESMVLEKKQSVAPAEPGQLPKD